MSEKMEISKIFHKIQQTSWNMSIYQMACSFWVLIGSWRFPNYEPVWYVPKTPLRYFLRYGTIPLQFGKHYCGTCHSAHSFNILQITKLCRFKAGQDAKIRPLEIFRYSKLLNLMVYHTHSKDTHSYEKIPCRHRECAVKKTANPLSKGNY